MVTTTNHCKEAIGRTKDVAKVEESTSGRRDTVERRVCRLRYVEQRAEGGDRQLLHTGWSPSGSRCRGSRKRFERRSTPAREADTPGESAGLHA
jgi:hypothetical protein